MWHLLKTKYFIFIFPLFFFFDHSDAAGSPKDAPRPLYKLSGVSRQNLLHLDYFAKDHEPQLAKSSRTPDSLKIVVLRVAFQPDSLETTTGDGNFTLTASDSTIIDPPPHDREYFDAQLTAVAHYYQTVSRGKLLLSGTVYPQQPAGSYQLPHTMDYYNPNTTGEELNQRLAELFRDAILAADTQDAVPFSQFDIVVVFHAGVGQDFADDYDTTPNDIPSAFLNTDHLRKYLGNNDLSYTGIQTANGTVVEGIILPETENQNGSEFALKGTFVLYLGNQIGLPSLFNTNNNRSGIGAWGLMDVGSSNYFGLIPAEPCAWSKVFMGWEQPIVLEPGTSIRIAVSKARSAHHIYKIPINSREYFLIENRSNDFNHDGITTGHDQFGHRLEFYPTGNFTAQIDTTIGERLGVITRVDDYDFSIPGAGILVWHIDDLVIQLGYTDNNVNGNPEHRGVDLEEADGSQDIGQSYGFLTPGSGSEYGVADDSFFADNEVHKIANRSDWVSFTASSTPASRSYSGANSGIELRHFSNADSVMEFDYDNLSASAGFPQRFAGENPVQLPPIVVQLAENRGQVIFLAPGNNQLFAWRADGKPYLDTSDSTTIQNWNGTTETFVSARFDTVPGYVSHPLLAGDLNGDGSPELIAAVSNHQLIIWTLPIESPTATTKATRIAQFSLAVDLMLLWNQQIIVANDNRLTALTVNGDLRWQRQTTSLIRSICLTKDRTQQFYLVVVTADGTIQKLTEQGEPTETTQLELALPYNSESAQRRTSHSASFQLCSGFLSNREEPDIVFIVDSTVYAVSQQLELLPGFPRILPQPIVLSPIIVDLDRDGFGEIIMNTVGELWTLNHNGTTCDGFPIALNQPLISQITLDLVFCSPLAIVTQQQGFLIFKDGTNDIVTIDQTGKQFDDQQLSGSGTLNLPFLSLADLNQDGLLEVIDVNSDGWLNVRGLTTTDWQVNGSWLQAGFDNSASRLNFGELAAASTDSVPLLTYAYNYPNPTQGEQTAFRYYLQQDAQVTIDIYDLAGESIAKLQAAGISQVENEIVWQLANIESGIYMARLAATNGNTQGIKIIKVAVVK